MQRQNDTPFLPRRVRIRRGAGAGFVSPPSNKLRYHTDKKPADLGQVFKRLRLRTNPVGFEPFFLIGKVARLQERNARQGKQLKAAASQAVSLSAAQQPRCR